MPGTTVEIEVSVRNDSGERLSGVLCQPAAGGCRRCVVFVHGLYQHKNVAFLREYVSARRSTRARTCHERGSQCSFSRLIAADSELDSAAFRFDMHGLGESEGASEFFPHHKNLEDLRAVLRHLRTVRRLFFRSCLLAQTGARARCISNICDAAARARDSVRVGVLCWCAAEGGAGALCCMSQAVVPIAACPLRVQMRRRRRKRQHAAYTTEPAPHSMHPTSRTNQSFGARPRHAASRLSLR